MADKPEVTYDDLQWVVEQICVMRQTTDAALRQTRSTATPTIRRLIEAFEEFQRTGRR